MQNINFDNIPKELKEWPNWVLWKLQKVKDRKTKVPYQVNGKTASSTNPDTWTSFDNVLQAYNKGQYSGIGFMFSNSEYAGIDLDKCITDGKINQFAKEIIDRASSYTEVSQSGTGIHIIVKGSIPDGINRKEIEMYSKERYFTMTGNRINENSIISAQELLNELYNKYKNVSKTLTKQSPTNREEININELLNKAFTSKSGFKIESLYRGNWQNLYNSQSEADQGLCNYLAFWLNKDPYLMDEAFRRSGLYREKWNRDDYRNWTINKAIRDCKETYQESFKKQGSSKNNTFIWEYDNCYWKHGSKDQIIPISNFIIEPLKYIECIDDPNKSVLDVLILTQEKEKIQRLYRASDFDKVSDFDKATNDFRTYFTGTLQDLKQLKVFIYSKVNKVIKGVNCGGMHFINGKWYFIDNKGCLNENGDLIDDLQLLNTEGISCELSLYEAISSEELKRLSHLLFNFNSLEITTGIMGFVSGVFIKEKLKAIGIKYEHLFNSGEAGSGKSETLENVIVPILGITNGVQSANGCTRFTLEKMAGSNNTIPFILDEYKPNSMGLPKVKLISNIMRDVYDWHTSLRGTEKLQLNIINLVAPIILSGEASTNETAVIERSLMLTFSKKESSEEKRTILYKNLKNSKLLNKLGRSLLEKSLKLTIDDVKKLYDDCAYLFKGSIQVDRLDNNALVTMTGIKVLIGVFEDLGLNFEKQTGLNFVDIASIIIKNITNENLAGGNTTKSIIDLTIEKINNMFALQDYIKSEFSLCRIDSNIISIRLKSIYDFFTKYIKDYNVLGEWLVWDDFNKQLQKSDYCISHNTTVRFFKLNSFLDEKKESKAFKAFKLNINLLKDKEIDIDNIIAYANKFIQ